MKLKNIIIPSIILSSLIGATYDQTTTPITQTDMFSLTGISFPANSFGFSSSPFGDYVQPTPTPTPSPTVTPTLTPTPYITPTIIEPKIKLQISNFNIQESNIDQKDGSNPNEQIFENSETLSNGTKANTQIKLSDKEFNLNVSILGEDKNSNDTNIKAPSDIEVTMDSSGNSTLKVDNDIEVIAKRDGKVGIKHKDLNIEVKSSGANIEISENKTITISKENIDSNNKKTISTITITADGEITANIINSNGVKQAFNFPIDSNNKGAKLENNALVGEYKALSEFFIVKDNSYTRGVNYGEKSVKIIPINTESQFEEKLYLDKNYRGIILRSGEAEILIDGEILEMEQDKEYIIIIQNSDTKALNYIYNKNKNYLHLTEGWSLISSPINQELNITETFWTKDLAYKFKNNRWIKNPENLKPNEGMWIKYNFNIFVYFNEFNSTKSYEFNSSILNSGWNLVGTGADVNLNSDEFESVWVYDNVTKEYINNPTQILQGYGFWIKR